ncbi:MBL fold metallo-hydrolase [Desulfobaculum bizertense]|uniref:Glyoxylase, beta-lactamase superfamily II n=1 Tax=Desulfobaculum bizertense DSM 18034 TaxID=1121442 RepID=A0A1T4WLI8_9BACT|nr:MBL fold metallo-hydrolase [Desulfobaculum bizertense]UIJ37064.1 MBL fold metallo-hydrolase [Desulfobaculum bizertense]SKA78184.1 Glyoxylase, beta-lactamase superfamily II [Desulfobaculum bizertense DSM 18034]
MKIRQFVLGPYQTNGYLISHDDKAVFVDPGGSPHEVAELVKSEGLKLEHIIVTHVHFDHMLGCAELARQTGATILVPEGDLCLFDEELVSGLEMGLPKVPEFEYELLKPGKTVFAGLKCRVLLTPGHTPGGMSLYFPEIDSVFVGDALFDGAIGRTDFTGGNMQTLLTSIKTQLFTLPEQTKVFPGHGGSTTIGNEKLHNPYFQSGFGIRGF